MILPTSIKQKSMICNTVLAVGSFSSLKTAVALSYLF